jgi:lipopolysaccharide transport system permease protein
MSQAHEVIIRPARGFEFPNLAELWRQRHVLLVLVWRNVARRYRQTLLGPLWFIIGPLVRMVVISLVLGRLAGMPSEGIPYPVFTYTALLPWELFQRGVTRSSAAFVTYQGIISKVYFPRLLVPAAEVLTAFVDFLLSFGILLAMILFYRIPLTPQILLLPAFLAMAMILALCLGLLMASWEARFRDVSNIMGLVLQFWFYGTPVAYSATVLDGKLPPALQFLFHLNPMNLIVEGCRWSLLDKGRPPDLWMAGTAAALVLLLAASSVLFLRTEHSIVDLV